LKRSQTADYTRHSKSYLKIEYLKNAGFGPIVFPKSNQIMGNKKVNTMLLLKAALFVNTVEGVGNLFGLAQR